MEVLALLVILSCQIVRYVPAIQPVFRAKSVSSFATRMASANPARPSSPDVKSVQITLPAHCAMQAFTPVGAVAPVALQAVRAVTMRPNVTSVSTNSTSTDLLSASSVHLPWSDAKNALPHPSVTTVPSDFSSMAPLVLHAWALCSDVSSVSITQPVFPAKVAISWIQSISA